MTDIRLETGFHERDRATLIELLGEYWASLDVASSFQNFDAELAQLPGEYVPPRGSMILARDPAGDLVGCVALRPTPGEADLCEMKRLYVRPSARGTGLGRRLAIAIMDEGRRLGYRRMWLDTLPSLTTAQGMYLRLGFRQTGTAGQDPWVLLFERDLGDAP